MTEPQYVFVKPVNESYVKIAADPTILYEIKTLFTFKVKNFEWKRRQNSHWKGDIRLFKSRPQHLPKGLLPKLEIFCEKKGYQLVYENYTVKPYNDPNITVKYVLDLYKSLKAGREPYQHQVMGVLKALRHKRRLFRSPTASGKSFLAYGLVRELEAKNLKGLMITPTINLVSQMTGDFVEYGWSEDFIHKIYEGQVKSTLKPLTISTWQSLKDVPGEWFEQFDYVIVDECHLADGASITKIMNNCVRAAYRVGMTGSLKDSDVSQVQLEALFGPLDILATTTELQEKGQLAPLKIEAICLNHGKRSFNSYQEEKSFLVSSEKRNKFITKLTLSLTGNTLVLFELVDKHGKILYDLIKKSTTRPVYYVSGEVEVEDRELIRRIMEDHENAIIVASYGTLSTGWNQKRLHNLIFASPTKARVRILQSIGRILRLHKTKDMSILYDISDNFNGSNTTLQHFYERIRLYIEEDFQFRTYPISLE